MNGNQPSGQPEESRRHARASRASAGGVSHDHGPRKLALHAASAAPTRHVHVSLDHAGHRLIRVATPVTFGRYEEQLSEAVVKGLLVVLFACAAGLLTAAVLGW